jgi:hypothetical protein
VLTPDQKTKLETLEAQMREHRGEHGHGNGQGNGQGNGGPPPAPSL